MAREYCPAAAPAAAVLSARTQEALVGQPTVDARPTVSLCMIVKDEAAARGARREQLSR